MEQLPTWPPSPRSPSVRDLVTRWETVARGSGEGSDGTRETRDEPMSPGAVALSAMQARCALRQLEADAAAADAGAAAAVAAARAATPPEPARVRASSPASAGRAPHVRSATSEGDRRRFIRGARRFVTASHGALQKPHEPNSPPPRRPQSPPRSREAADSDSDDDDAFEDALDDHDDDDAFEDARSSPLPPALSDAPPTPTLRARRPTDDEVSQAASGTGSPDRSAERTPSEASEAWSPSATSFSPLAARALHFDDLCDDAQSEAPAPADDDDDAAPSEASAGEAATSEAPAPAPAEGSSDEAAQSEAPADEVTMSEAPAPSPAADSSDEAAPCEASADEAATSEAPAPSPAADSSDEAAPCEASADEAATSEAPAPSPAEDSSDEAAPSEASADEPAMSEAPAPAKFGDGAAPSEAPAAEAATSDDEASTRRSLLIAKATRDAEQAARAAEAAQGATRQHISDWNCSACELPACGPRSTVGGYQVRASTDCEQDPLNFLEVVSGLDDIDEDIVITQSDENDGAFDSLTTVLGCTGGSMLCTGSGGPPARGRSVPPPPPPIPPPSLEFTPPPRESECPVS